MIWPDTNSNLATRCSPVSNSGMRRVWQVVLPICGLLFFAMGTYFSMRWNSEVNRSRPARYFYWSSIKLDSDPLNKHPLANSTRPCSEGTEDCVDWEPQSIWVDASVAARTFFWVALPAFVVVRSSWEDWQGSESAKWFRLW